MIDWRVFNANAAAKTYGFLSVSGVNFLHRWFCPAAVDSGDSFFSDSLAIAGATSAAMTVSTDTVVPYGYQDLNAGAELWPG